MNTDLTDRQLLQAVGQNVNGKHGAFLGYISEIFHDETESITHLILKSSNILDMETRFFAVPASPKFIVLNDAGNLFLQLNKNALRYCKQAPGQNGTQPAVTGNNTIYELSQIKT